MRKKMDSADEPGLNDSENTNSDSPVSGEMNETVPTAENGTVTNNYEEKIAELEQEITELNNKANEIQNKWLRSVADTDNFRKRTQKEKADWRDFYHEEILEEILPVLDNFDRALMTTLEGEEAKKFAEGIILVDKQLHDILNKHGLIEIESIGKPFDPHFHEAVMMVESDDYPDHTIIEEIRKGYLKGDKVIRPAMVKVSKRKELNSEDISLNQESSNEKSES